MILGINWLTRYYANLDCVSRSIFFAIPEGRAFIFKYISTGDAFFTIHIVRFGQKRGMLSPRYIGLFGLLERVGKVTYKLALPPRLSGVHNVIHVSMLKKNYQGPTPHNIDFNDTEVNYNVSYTKRSVQILDRDSKELRNKEIPSVKV